MRSPLRRLLVILIVGLTTVVVADAPAHACSCKQLTVSQRIDGADFVFSGTVTMATGPTNVGRAQVISYDVKVDRVYKGSLDSPRTTVKTAASSPCGLTDLTADNRYLFFVRSANANLRANTCGGTKPATSSLTQKIVALLGTGTTPIPPTPAEPDYTLVADARPAALTRLAAPGAALLIIGLLGLLVFGRLGRPSRP